MSLSEFANLLGTSKQVLSRYERGENTPKITTVAHYAKVLNVSIAFLTNDNVTDRMSATPSEDKTNSPDAIKITEGEKALLELFRMLPDEAQKMYLEVLRNSLKSQQ
jgi:transcriptional regulator with XRE-family HTH domain